jgi:hypothetical protein
VATFEQHVSEALNAPFSGWDFSWLAARSTAGTLPWSYRRDVVSRATAADTMLDMGTGGGNASPGFGRGHRGFRSRGSRWKARG